MRAESLYDDRLYALSKSVLSSRNYAGRITLSPHCPELKENQKLQTVKPKIRKFRDTEFYNFQTAHRSAAGPNRNFPHCESTIFNAV
jgi:hypothetical protein